VEKHESHYFCDVCMKEVDNKCNLETWKAFGIEIDDACYECRKKLKLLVSEIGSAAKQMIHSKIAEIKMQDE